jgi:hypothetical protein
VTAIAVVRSSVTTLPTVVVANTAPVMEVASLQKSLSSPPAASEASPAAVHAAHAVCQRPVRHYDKHGHDREARTERKPNHTRERRQGSGRPNARTAREQHPHNTGGCTAGARDKHRRVSAPTAASEKTGRVSSSGHRANRHGAASDAPATHPESEQPRRRAIKVRHPTHATTSNHGHNDGS